MFTACTEYYDTHQASPDNYIETGELQVTLHDGQKWEMDDHTRMIFKAMTERLEAGGDINAVGKGLKSNLDKLIQGWTRTGDCEDEQRAET